LTDSDTARAKALGNVVSIVENLSRTDMDGTMKLCKLASISAKQAVWNSLYLLLAVLALGIVVTVFLTRSITAPLHKCLEFAQGVAGGNLTQHLDVESRDEIVRLSDALRHMVETLKVKIAEATSQSQVAREKEEQAMDAMRQAEEATARAESAMSEGMHAAAHQLEGTVNSISTALSQLSAQIAQSERGAITQASRVSETAAAMEEMNSTVLEVARNAGEASDVSAKTREKAAEGATVVDGAVQSIQNVRTGALAMKSDMVTLDQHARAVSQIMGVISDIADQTNLLALNAAIEAARAGEAGRGFAVVADEVRKLAEKTMASTTDVGNAIKSIQQSADRSMSQVDMNVQGVEESTVATIKSGEALSEIVKMADLTADQVRAIATASEQQSSTSEEINRSILEVNTIASETASAMKEAASAIMELSKQSDILSKLVDDLKRR
ncbi:MAG: HAMP domain-containing methyl-accepting chemotaxis protein, partial [Bilophila sp.]